VRTAVSKCKFTNWKERTKNRDDWRNPLRRNRSALEYSAIEEEEEVEEEEE
jgi:hypothetical protein